MQGSTDDTGDGWCSSLEQWSQDSKRSRREGSESVGGGSEGAPLEGEEQEHTDMGKGRGLTFVAVEVLGVEVPPMTC
ncbi:hypothetical protein GUJ93_ZPchr0001g29484 [Zizania palustris]|uniref:Uncharacterized protein n=1 Tax=Zizania palustris TaxID=103762 RepID=A0A8J5RYH0_ZIZPA|nr:hypothetical protein GUJ93_ZPchr0001g29484 [Zizania palustris]